MKNIVDREDGQSLFGMLLMVIIVGLVAWYLMGGQGDTTGSGANPEKALESGQSAQIQQEISTLRQSIRRYRTENGKYPPDLETLVDENYVSGGAIRSPDGSTYRYNPRTGSVETP